MNHIEAEVRDPQSPSALRVDIYRGIHKAVRAFMCDTLTMVGQLDIDDDADVTATVAQVRGLAAFCADHLAHENQFIHPAMEARRPGSSAWGPGVWENAATGANSTAAIAGNGHSKSVRVNTSEKPSGSTSVANCR